MGNFLPDEPRVIEPQWATRGGATRVLTMDGQQDAPEPSLEAAYLVQTPEDNRRLYSQWAKTYEEEFVTAHGYVYHRHVAELFCEEYTNKRGVVLDVGCGTGIVGVELRRLGIVDIDGIDISPEMLAIAADKGDTTRPIYRNLIVADLTGPVDLPGHQYGGIVSAGTFTHGHLGPESIQELIRIAQLGAPFVIGVNSAHFEERGFGEWLDRRRDDARISEYQLIDVPIYEEADKADPDNVARVIVFALLSH